jgi:hypothetical protein
VQSFFAENELMQVLIEGGIFFCNDTAFNAFTFIPFMANVYIKGANASTYSIGRRLLKLW